MGSVRKEVDLTMVGMDPGDVSKEGTNTKRMRHWEEHEEQEESRKLSSGGSIGAAPLDYRAAVASTNKGTPSVCVNVEPIKIENEDITINEEEGCPTVCFSQKIKDQLNQRWENAIIIKSMGASFTYNFFLFKMRQKWSHLKGYWHLMDIEKDCFIVRFDIKEDMQYVLCNGPWIIVGHYLALQKWKPDYNAMEDNITHLTVWIRFAGLKTQWFDNSILTTLGNMIGTTLKVDYRTSLLARGQYARVCIELDITKPLIHKIKIEDHWYIVQYEGLHLVCFNCGIYGHAKEKCKKGLEKQKDDTTGNNKPLEENEMDTARRMEEKKEKEAKEREIKANMEKFEALNKWNLVTYKRSIQRQDRTKQEKKKEVQRQGGDQEKGKAIAAVQETPKLRHTNPERLNIGNNGPNINKKKAIGNIPMHQKVVPTARSLITQNTSKQYMPSSQTLTVNGVQVHAFNQPVIYHYDKGETKDKEKEDEVPTTTGYETVQELKQSEEGTDMEGVVSYSTQNTYIV